MGPVINPKKKRRGNYINKIIKDGKCMSDPHGIANALNEYFCNIGNELQAKFTNTDDQYLTYLPDDIMHNFFLQPITASQVKCEILKLNSKKSLGGDNIGAKIIQICPDVFSQNLSKIYNNSISKGEYPQQMKIARVMALYKKGEKYKPDNYLPISLLSCINKIFEKILCKQLLSFIERFAILYSYQFGFRQLYSTTLALIEFSDTVHRLLDEKNYVIGIFVDFTKAFDTVDHDIILSKLDRYGIRGHANDFFRSYLTNREQYTFVNGAKSETKRINFSVPQGSVLGPLFFLLYINDIYRAVDDTIIRLFADDTSFLIYDQTLNTLKNKASHAFQGLFDWCKANRLTISVAKTNFVLFHTPNKPMEQNLKEIVTDEISIERVTNIKYLGVIIEEKLNWNMHINLCATRS